MTRRAAFFGWWVAAVAAVACIAVEACTPAHADAKVAALSRNELLEARAWADSVIATLSTAERVGQLFVPRLDLTATAEGRAAIRKMVSANHIGGFLLGKGTLTDYATLINEAQAVAKVPLMVTLDGEWGMAMRITDAPRYPYNMGLGAIRNEQLLYDYGREVGRQCRAVGINVDFAPVLDVNSNPANPVIGYRSFGEDASEVARLGVAFSQGMESMGVLSVAKHFPGHGDTSTDSHKTLPLVAHSRTMMEQIDLLPFKKYIDAGLGGVMVGHLNVPSLDASGTPASLSSKITSGLLKEQMGFKGLVFTDALAMKGAAGGVANISIAALKAGADVLLSPVNTPADIKALTAAVERGEIDRTVIDERCRKLLVYKYLLGLNRFVPADVKAVGSMVNSPEADALLSRLADAMMTVISNRDDILPVRDLGHRSIAVVCVGKPSDCTFARYCAKYANVDLVSVAGGAIGRSEMARLKKADVVVAGVFSNDKWARGVVSQLADLDCLVPVFFMNPYKMGSFGSMMKRLPTLIAAYDNLPAVERAAAEAVFGGIDVTGRFPVNVYNVASLGAGVDVPKVRLGYSTPLAVGMNPDIDACLDSIARAAIKAGAMSGCQVLVAKDGQVVIDKAYGHTDFGERGRPVTTETLFDLASVTKTNATLVGLMKTVDEGLVTLDDRIGDIIGELDSTAKGDITIRQLLFHESGMPPVINIYRLALDTASYSGPVISSKNAAPYTVKMGKNEWGNADARLRSDIYSTRPDDDFAYAVADGIYVNQDGIDEVMRAVHQAPLRSGRYEYSCLNFMLLKEVQETLTGVDLDQWIDTEIYGRLGAWHTTFLPLQRFSAGQIAATENDRLLRRQHLQGYVHDEMAAFSGGVQGNAGLFSTAGDVAKLCQMWLCDGAYGGEQIISRETSRTFTSTRSQSGRRGLGFDLLRHNRSIDSPRASRNSYGHTGFTGTCYWVDPENNLIFVFLSNRVNPSRDNRAWTSANPRGAMLRAVYDSL